MSAAGASNKWLIALAAMIATILEVLDVTIGNVALPHMQASFSASTDEVTWILTSYLVSNGIVIPLTGWLSSWFGRKRFFIGSTILFTASSMLCGMAWNLESMVAFRILQGVGGAAMIPMSQAVLMEAFPPAQHGLAMAVWGMGLMAAPILGPALGGWITDNYSWRWIYYVNLPFGILAVMLQAAFIPDSPHQKRAATIDWLGIVLVVVTIGAGQIVLDRGERADWFESSWVWGMTATSMIALATLVWWERRVESPVVDLSLFKFRAFTAAAIMSTLLSFTLYGNLVTWPLYMQQVMGYTAFEAGWAMAPRGLATMASMFVVGKLYGKIDVRWILFFGFGFVALGSWEMTFFTAQSDRWSMVWPSLVHGLGMGATFVPLSAVALAVVPVARLGNASGVYNLMRNAGGSVGIAVASTFIVRRAQVHQSVLGEHVDATSPLVQQAFQGAADAAIAGGTAPGGALERGTAMLYRLVQHQSAVLAFGDVFLILTVAAVVLVPLLLLLGKLKGSAAPAAAGH